MLTLTNLRVMWISLTRSSINLCEDLHVLNGCHYFTHTWTYLDIPGHTWTAIGFNTISSISTQRTLSVSAKWVWERVKHQGACGQYNPIVVVDMVQCTNTQRPYHWVPFLLFQKLKGVTESLHLLTKAKKQQFEYIFTNLDPNVCGCGHHEA